MIVNTARGYVLGNPTKCATISLYGAVDALADEAREAGRDPVHLKPGKQHSMTVPEPYARFDRWLMIRSPYARIVSTWDEQSRFERVRPGWVRVDELIPGGIRSSPFPDFVRAFVKYRQERRAQGKHVGVRFMSLSECLDELGEGGRVPVSTVRVESLPSDLALLDPELADRLGHLNRGRHTRSGTPPPDWTPDLLELVNEELAAADCERFGYEMRTS